MTDNELTALLAKIMAAQARTDEQLTRTDEQLTRTDEQLTRTDEQLTRTNEQLAETDELIKALAKKQQATDEQMAKTDANIDRLAAKIDRLAEMYGGVGNNQGQVAEEFFVNSLRHRPILNGIRFDTIDKNVSRYLAKVEDEYDIILKNGTDLFVIEVKYRLHPKDIERVIEHKRVNFQRLFPEYHAYRQHWGVATFGVADEVKALALQQGLTVLQRRGEVIETTAP